MKKIELFIIPYAKENEVKTRLFVDGNKIDSKDNRLTNLVVYQPMRRWLSPYKKKLFVWEGLLPEIIEEFNDKSVQFQFHGCMVDYLLFRKNILEQQLKLNRNGGAVEVVIEHIDLWNTKSTVKDLLEILEDLQVEADNWGEDGILDCIEPLQAALKKCKVAVQPRYLAAPDRFCSMLQAANIVEGDDAPVSLIPVDGGVPICGISEYLRSLTGENTKHIVLNTGSSNDVLFDTVCQTEGVRYLENPGQDYMEEIKKTYYLFVLPEAIQKTGEILKMFPDHHTNSFLIDISCRLGDLFDMMQ